MIKDNIKNYLTYELNKRLKAGLEYLSQTDFFDMENGRYDIIKDEVFAIVQDYQTKDEGKLEGHRKYIDIQYIVKGIEKIGFATKVNQQPVTDYDNDIEFYDDRADMFIPMRENDFAIFYPQDLHMPCIKFNSNDYVKKVVVKVAV
jgi:YhcH/YjgK/YiaL family protein